MSADAGTAPPPRRTKASVVRLRSDSRYWLLLPAVLAIIAVSLFPLTASLVVALKQTPNGFEALWADPQFWDAIRRTLTVAALALPVELLCGLALAAIFLGRMPGKTVFVSLMALPALVAPVVAGTTWRMLLDNDYGPINHMLSWILGNAVMTLWIADPDHALSAIVLVDIWQWTPLMFLLMLGALTNVDRGQIEAAAIADAGPWRTLMSVVLPAIWPAIAVALLIRGFDLLRLFDVVWVLTRGGPEGRTETLSVFAYEQLLASPASGATAAMAFAVTLALSLVAMALLFRLGRER